MKTCQKCSGPAKNGQLCWKCRKNSMRNYNRANSHQLSALERRQIKKIKKQKDTAYDKKRYKVKRAAMAMEKLGTGIDMIGEDPMYNENTHFIISGSLREETAKIHHSPSDGYKTPGWAVKNNTWRSKKNVRRAKWLINHGQMAVNEKDVEYGKKWLLASQRDIRRSHKVHWAV